MLPPLDAHADARSAEAGADDKASDRVKRAYIAGNHGKRNEDHRRGDAQDEDNDKDEKRSDHGSSVKVQRAVLLRRSQ